MTVSLIVAHDLDGVIGRDGRLPWHLPDDLARFRALTLGHSVVMGRRTFESIGHALPGRANFVLSRTPGYVAPNARVVSSVPAALAVARRLGDVFVIGGAEVYAAALPHCTRAYLTWVYTHTDGRGLTHFPCDLSGWEVDPRTVERFGPDTRHAHAFTTRTAERP